MGNEETAWICFNCNDNGIQRGCDFCGRQPETTKAQRTITREFSFPAQPDNLWHSVAAEIVKDKGFDISRPIKVIFRQDSEILK